MLPTGERNRRRSDKREKKALKNLNCWRKKRDGTVRGAKMGGFARFWDRDNMGGFPDSGDVSVRDREVKKLG
jgi:predicted Rdx family selenoprotein